MKLGSLFDGSGGFPLSGVLNGIEPVWAAEVEPYPIAVTRSRFPHMKHYGNVCKINGAEIEPVDIITFGSPCQDLSVAGKRAGIQDGERSNLFFEAVRIIKEMREATNGEYPKYAVWENVPGAFSSNKGWDFHAVLEAFCAVCDSAVSIPEPYDAKRTKLVWNKAGEIVGDNYSVAWRTLDAQYWGVSQRRKRIYLVADFTGGCAGEILFKPDCLRGDSTQSDEAGKGATVDAVGGVDGSVGVECLNPWDCQSIRQYGANGIYPALNSNSGGGQNRQGVVFSFDSLSSNSMKSSNPHEPVIAMATQQGGAEIAENLCPTITASAGMSGNNQPVIALQANGIDRADTVDRHAECYPLNEQIILRHGALGKNTGFGAGEDGDPAYTLQANHPHAVCYDARGNGDGETACFTMQRSDEYQACDVASTQSARQYKSATDLIVEKKRKYIIRRLLPVECARLQGFPDDWGHLAPYDPADADFWEDVRKTHAEINGKAYKPVKNLKKWHDKLHTDGAEYKMWGNGIALPCAEYVLHGIAAQGAKTLGSLFDGSGGFPLAGALNGITPLWASEVEPYPIAVTKSRFREENHA